MEDLRRAKSDLRKQMLAARAALDAAAVAVKSAAITTALLALPEWVAARTVLLYAPLAGEVDVRPAIPAGLAAGKRIALPRVRSRLDEHGVPRPTRPHRMDAVRISAFPGDLRPGVMRILEPAGSDVLDPREIDLVGVPGLAFDLAGRRLGYGGGFYDAFLAQLPDRAARVGVAFAFQVVPEVPAGPGDRRVAAVVTEQGVLRCAPTA